MDFLVSKNEAVSQSCSRSGNAIASGLGLRASRRKMDKFDSVRICSSLFTSTPPFRIVDRRLSFVVCRSSFVVRRCLLEFGIRERQWKLLTPLLMREDMAPHHAYRHTPRNHCEDSKLFPFNPAKEPCMQCVKSAKVGSWFSSKSRAPTSKF